MNFVSTYFITIKKESTDFVFGQIRRTDQDNASSALQLSLCFPSPSILSREEAEPIHGTHSTQAGGKSRWSTIQLFVLSTSVTPVSLPTPQPYGCPRALFSLGFYATALPTAYSHIQATALMTVTSSPALVAFCLMGRKGKEENTSSAWWTGNKGMQKRKAWWWNWNIFLFLFLFFLSYVSCLLLTFSPTLFQTGETLISCVVFVLYNNYCPRFLLVWWMVIFVAKWALVVDAGVPLGT